MGRFCLITWWCVTNLVLLGRVDALPDSGAIGRLYPVDCVWPSCLTNTDRKTMWPFEDPNFYLQCEGGSDEQFKLVRQPCKDRRLFHFTRQTCTVPAEWEEPCPESGGGPGLPLEPCPVVRCETKDDLRYLWPDEDPTRFHQCIPQATGGIVPVTQTCPSGTLFSVRYQACITALRWTEECSFNSGEITPGPTGENTEPSTTTTPMPSTTTTTSITTTESGGWHLCQPPICKIQDPVLYPDTDWLFYWQCVPQPSGFWEPQRRPCGAGTVFHYGMQLCVFPVDWINFCPE